jgi:hypothetical protein
MHILIFMSYNLEFSTWSSSIGYMEIPFVGIVITYQNNTWGLHAISTILTKTNVFGHGQNIW